MRHLSGILLGILLVALIYTSYEAYHWKQVADVRGWQAEQAYQYLSQPVATLNGQPVTRADVLGAVTSQALQQAQK